jgi:apolipoprotein N-acyltransferase
VTRRVAAALAFAASWVLTFPVRVGELHFDVGAAVGWVALVPLLWGIDGLRPARAALQGFAGATLGFVGVLFWLFVVVHEHGHAPAWLAVAAVLGLAAICALPVAAAAALTRAFEERVSWLVLPAAWVVGEQLRGTVFPWAFLGYALHRDGPALALAQIAGVYGLSFLLALTSVLLYRRRLAPALAVVALAHVAGLGLALRDPAPGAELRAAVIQANIPQGEKWDPERMAHAFERHLYLSGLAAAAEDLDLIVWPETALPVLLERDANARAAVRGLARDTGAALVLGGMGATSDGRFYNSAFAVDDQGEIVDRYDKSVLVPFGEYVPLRRWLGFATALAPGLAGASDVTPGDGPRTLRGLAQLRGDHAAAVLICYEVIHPSVVREAVRKGARLLLNLTNDAWYGSTSAPHQFLAISATRSAEHGLPMLRAANTGVSAVIDARGRIQRHTEIFEGSAFVATVPQRLAGGTLYTRIGDVVVWASWGTLLGIGGFEVVRKIVGRGRGSRRRRSRDGRRPSGSGRAGRGTPEASLTSTPSAND